MNKKQIYFKSDFTVILASEAQWGGCPFRLSFYTASPSRAFVASFDGENWENCRLLEDGRLEVAINQKDGTVQTLMGIGTLMCAPEFYLDNDAFSDHVCNVFVKPFEVECGVEEHEDVYKNLAFSSHKIGIHGTPTGQIVGGYVSDSAIYVKKGQVVCLSFDEESQYKEYEFGFGKKVTAQYSWEYDYFDIVYNKNFVAEEDCEVRVCFMNNNPRTNLKVTVSNIGDISNIVLSLTGSSTLETLGTLPAYYQKGEKGDTGSFEDAPADGKQYARQNNAWAVVAGGGVSDVYTKAESDNRYQPAGNYATTAQLANYQPTITDLDQIRENAALGANAVQTEIDPTVPSWAKQPNKPTYTAAEVGAASHEELTQLDHKVGDVSQLDEKVAAEDLVKAINKAAQQGGGGGTDLSYLTSAYNVYKLADGKDTLVVAPASKNFNFRKTFGNEPNPVKEIICFNTTQHENATMLFDGQIELEKVPKFLITNKCKELSLFFSSNPEKLKEIDVSEWDVSECKTISNFPYFVKELDVSKWNVSKAEKIQLKLYGLEKPLDVTSWDTSALTNANRMFEACASNIYTPADGLNFRNVTDAINAFSDQFYDTRPRPGGEMKGWNHNERTYIGLIDVTGNTQITGISDGTIFYGQYGGVNDKFTTFLGFKGLCIDCDISHFPNLSAESVHNLVQQAAGGTAGSPIKIYIHATAMSRWAASSYFAGDTAVCQTKHITVQ